MNGRRSKQLRRMAREELIEAPPERDLVAADHNRTTAINSPNSRRGFYLQLKKAYDNATRTGFFLRRN